MKYLFLIFLLFLVFLLEGFLLGGCTNSFTKQAKEAYSRLINIHKL